MNPLRAIGPFGAAIGRSLLSTRFRAIPNIARGLLSAPNTRGFRTWPADAQDTYVQMMKYYDVHGLPAGKFEDMANVLPHKPTSYEQFARRIATERGV